MEWGQRLLPACCLPTSSQLSRCTVPHCSGTCRHLVSFLGSSFLVNTGFTRRTHPCFLFFFFFLHGCTWITVLWGFLQLYFLFNNTCSNQYWLVWLCAFITDDEMLNHPSQGLATDTVRKQEGGWNEKKENDIILCLCNTYFRVSAYTGSNSPLTLVCTGITFTFFTKLFLRSSWKGSWSHSPFCWLCYALPTILVLTLQGGYWSLHVMTMWSQKIHNCQYNCAYKWCAKWMQSICATFKNQNPASSEQKSVVMWKWIWQ